MNVIKYRPVGSPSGKVIRVRVSQAKRAIYFAVLAACRTRQKGQQHG